MRRPGEGSGCGRGNGKHELRSGCAGKHVGNSVENRMNADVGKMLLIVGGW